MATSGAENVENNSSNASTSVEAPTSFDEFYTEVKQIEKRDSVLTPIQQLDRLTRPGATYFNLNPFDVLQVDPETPISEVKVKYRRMSILVHPDKNQDDQDRAQKAFEAVNKAYKTLENEEGYKRCKEIVEEAKERADEMIATKKKQLKKEGKPQNIPEDEPDNYKHAVYVQTCKLFADLERLRQRREAQDMHERKRKAEEEEDEKERKKIEAEWTKNYEESRTDRVNSWRDWKGTSTGTEKKSKKEKSKEKSKSKSKGMFKPPKPKMEQR